jgi:hypothetical protein
LRAARPRSFDQVRDLIAIALERFTHDENARPTRATAAIVLRRNRKHSNQHAPIERVGCRIRPPPCRA